MEKAFLEHPTTCRLSRFGNGQGLIGFLVNNPDEHLSDLFVLALNMPILNGFFTLKLIRHHERWRTILVAILITSNEPGDEAICQQVGADAFFVKPPAYSNLIRIVEQSIDK